MKPEDTKPVDAIPEDAMRDEIGYGGDETAGGREAEAAAATLVGELTAAIVEAPLAGVDATGADADGAPLGAPLDGDDAVAEAEPLLPASLAYGPRPNHCMS